METLRIRRNKNAIMAGLFWLFVCMFYDTFSYRGTRRAKNLESSRNSSRPPLNHYRMNELSVIRSLCLRKDFWDRRGANIASCSKEIDGERLFRRPKKRFWSEISAFSPQLYHKWMKIMLTQGLLLYLLTSWMNILHIIYLLKGVKGGGEGGEEDGWRIKAG